MVMTGGWCIIVLTTLTRLGMNAKRTACDPAANGEVALNWPRVEVNGEMEVESTFLKVSKQVPSGKHTKSY